VAAAKNSHAFKSVFQIRMPQGASAFYVGRAEAVTQTASLAPATDKIVIVL
jgi:hypothetical protein